MGKWVTGNTGRTEGNESSQWSPDQGANPDRCFCAPGWLRVWETRLYCTGSVGGHWARERIALGLAEEIVDGGAQKRAALLLLTHQLWRQRDATVQTLKAAEHMTPVVTQHRGIFKGK